MAMTNLQLELIRKNKMYFVRDGYDWSKPRSKNGFPPTLFHGTSAALLPSILQSGLSYQNTPISMEDHLYVEEIRKKYSSKENPIINIIGYRRHSTLSASYSYYVAANHAAIGPESIERLIKCLEIWLKEELEPEEILQLKKLRNKYTTMMKMHMPVVVCLRLEPTQISINENDAAYLLTKPELYNQIVETIEKQIPLGELSSRFDLQTVNKIKELYYLKAAYPKVTASELMEIFVRKDHYTAAMTQVPMENIVGIILAGSVAAQVA
jgi:hypothetical protein